MLQVYLCKLNVFYPNLLGFKFWSYRTYIRKNFQQFNAERQLLKMTNDALNGVPYYNNNLSTVSSLKDFQKQMPFIDKDEVMNHWDEFQLNKYSKSKTVSGTTGGTSGKPLKLIIPKNRYVFELGTLYTMWANVGWKGQTRAVLRNTILSDGVTFKINPLKKELIFDGFRTSEVHYNAVYTTMKRYNIRFLHAYPSSAYQFCVYIKKNKLDTSIFQAFFLGSEGLLEEQRTLFKELDIKIYHWYGHSEKLVLGGYCENSDLIHIEPTYGYFELIDEQGEHISEIGKVGEIVGTTLHNKYMPLLRYRTGDFAEYAGNYCSSCNRHLPLIKNIQGRRDKNKIYLQDKSYVSITALNLHSDLYNHINGMQYVQYVAGEIEIHLIKGESFTQETEKQYKLHFKKSLKGKCSFKIIYKEKIAKEQNGKFLPLKQYIND